MCRLACCAMYRYVRSSCSVDDVALSLVVSEMKGDQSVFVNKLENNLKTKIKLFELTN